jgi:hypothetical protein
LKSTSEPVEFAVTRTSFHVGVALMLEMTMYFIWYEIESAAKLPPLPCGGPSPVFESRDERK